VYVLGYGGPDGTREPFGWVGSGLPRVKLDIYHGLWQYVFMHCSGCSAYITVSKGQYHGY